MNRDLLKIILGGSVLCAPALLHQLQAAKPATISVYPDEKGQTVGGIGGGIVYYSDWLTNHPNREAVYDTLFNGLGLSCLRMGNWAIDDVESDWYSVRNDSIVYADAKKYCGKSLPVLMASWSAPASLKANNDRNGSTARGKASLKKVNGAFVYDWYGNWWTDALKRYRKVGVYPDYVSIQNEPDCDEASYNTMVFNPTETTDVAAYGKALSAVASKIKQLDNPPKLIGPDVLGIGWNQTQKYLDKLDRKLLSGYAFHYYHSGVNGNDRYSHPNDFIEAMQDLATDCADKPMFMTENSNLEGMHTLDCMYTAWFIANAFNINKVSYYNYWNLIWGDNGNGCISLQKWDSTYAKPWQNGMQVNPDYHGLRHFSKFVRPGMQLIGTWASTNQMTTCGFMMPDKSAYTIVVINQGADEFDIKHDLNLPYDQYESSVTVSVPEWGVYSMHIGEFGNSVYMPSHSIVTITYKMRHPKVSPYVFVYDEVAANGNRTNPSNWTPKFVPWATDTILIAKGECKFENNYTHNGPVTVAPEGVFRLTGDVTANHMINLSGTMKVYTSKRGFTLSGRGIVLDGPATFNVGHDTSRFFLNTEIFGQQPIAKTGDGILQLCMANHNYTGTWTVADGTLLADADFALGTDKSNVVVEGNGRLAVQQNTTVARLDVNNDNQLLLQRDLTAKYAYFNGVYLQNGVYTEESHPEYVKGSGRLIVSHPYPVLYKPSPVLSQQVVPVDSSIINFVYAWSHAETVDVDWNPHQPGGLQVEVDTVGKNAVFSGTPTETGEFAYTVSTVSLEDSVVVGEGLLTVVERETAGCDALIAGKTQISLSPAVLKNGMNTNLTCVAQLPQTAEIGLVSALGTTMWLQNVEVAPGCNRFTLLTAGLKAGVYFVKVMFTDRIAVLKMVVE